MICLLFTVLIRIPSAKLVLHAGRMGHDGTGNGKLLILAGSVTRQKHSALFEFHPHLW